MKTYHLHFIPYMTPMWAVVEVATNNYGSTSSVLMTFPTMEEALIHINMLDGNQPLGVKIT